MSCLILSHFVPNQETFSSLAKALAPICRVDGSSPTQHVEVMKGEAGSRGFSSIRPSDMLRNVREAYRKRQALMTTTSRLALLAPNQFTIFFVRSARWACLDRLDNRQRHAYGRAAG